MLLKDIKARVWTRHPIRLLSHRVRHGLFRFLRLLLLNSVSQPPAGRRASTLAGVVQFAATLATVAWRRPRGAANATSWRLLIGRAAADPGRAEYTLALHGDERVGPATALALARWLVERYDSDAWIRRLVDTRTVLIMPMTNAVGVDQNTREELGIDPNRDFPYDQNPSSCMATVCARALNEVYRARLLQLVVTFHGGMQAIAYNWGSFNYYRGKPHRSPDDVSQRDIANEMSRFAGTGRVPGQRLYPTSTMNDLVYPVHGGLEDWGYGASWDTAFVKPCTPRTYGGYPAAKTSAYPEGAVRAFTVLVETSDSKTCRRRPTAARRASMHRTRRPRPCAAECAPRARRD